MDFAPIVDGYHLEALCPQGDALWFSDVFDGGVRRRSADGRVDVWLPDRRLIGGILLNADGKVLCSGVGGIVWVDPDTGASGTLIDYINGEPIRGVNEMIPDGHGGLYFGTTDPAAQERGEEMALGGLYRLDTSGAVSLVYHGIGFSNGVGLSADGRWLYGNETMVGTFAYDLQSDDKTGRLLLQQQVDCDGMAVDVEGNIWVTGYETSDLLRLAADGSTCERVATPVYGISNVRFAGVDGRDLYITATSPVVMAEYQSGKTPSTRGGMIYRGRSPVAGLPIPPTNFCLG
jgi:sugar lactone lactonase YvrE